MKRAVILHGTDGTPLENWFPWLKGQLETKGYEVWVPQLPGASEPNARRYTQFLLNDGWDFADNLIIGHSSGAVEILHLLQNLPEGVSVRTAVCVAAFSEVLAEEPDWKQLKGLFEEPFRFAKIKQNAQDILFVHASNDPYCDPKQAEMLAEHLNAEYIELPDGKHFSASRDPAWREFPQLLQILNERDLLD